MPASRIKVKTRKGLFFDGSALSPAERQEGKRQLRKGQILSLLRTDGPLSRAEISRALGFNLRTVSWLVDSLVEEKLVIENEGRRAPAGRPPTPVQLNSAAACVLGIDVGRARTCAALMDLQGKVLARTECESTKSTNAEEQCDWLERVVAEFLAQHRGKMPPLAGAGMATVGIAHLLNAPWSCAEASEPARQRLESLLRVPVVVDSDSRFAALGEKWFGKAKGKQNAVIFILTEGLGVASICEGRLLSGNRGWAGEVGHLPLGEPDIPCFCGSKSCLENTVSGAGIVRMAKAAGLSARKQSANDIAALARKGSEPAAEAFRRFACGLAQGITVALATLNPEVVVLGGPLARHSDLFLEHALAEVRKLAVPFILEATTIEVSELFDDAILLGACMATLNQIYDPAHVPMGSLL